MVINEIMSTVLSQFPGATMVRRSKQNFIAVPMGANEEGVMEYAKIAVGTLLSKDTQNRTAFDFDAAVAEYAEYDAIQQEKASKPKTSKKSGPDPEKQAAKEARKNAAFAWLVDNPGQHPTSDVKNALPDVYGDITIMQCGGDLTELWKDGLIDRITEKGKNYYAAKAE